MSTYAGVNFNLLNDATITGWTQSPNITSRHIPYSNQDDTQDLGRSNYHLSGTAHLLANVDLGILQQAVGIVPRTLTGHLGTHWTNTYLISLTNPRRVNKCQWLVEVEFMRDGT